MSWLVVMPICILELFEVPTRYDFSPVLPGCFFLQNCNDTVSCKSWVYTHISLVLGSGSVLPVAIYTILYIKSRRLFSATQTLYAPTQQQMKDNDRQNKATKTFALMVITFLAYSAFSASILIVRGIPFTRDIKGISFFLSDITLLYLITDFLLVWKNQNGKQVIKKLINTILRKQVCGSHNAMPPPISTTTTGQQKGNPANPSPAPSPSKDQTDPTNPPLPAPSTDLEQVENTNPAPTPSSRHGQINMANPAPPSTSTQSQMAADPAPAPTQTQKQEDIDSPVTEPSLTQEQTGIAIPATAAKSSQEQENIHNPAPVPTPCQEQRSTPNQHYECISGQEQPNTAATSAPTCTSTSSLEEQEATSTL